MRKVVVCADCRMDFSYEHRRGPSRQRCDNCTEVRRRAVNAAKGKRWRDADPDRARAVYNRSNRKRLADPDFLKAKNEAHLMRKYGLTMADFDTLLEQQGGVCAICKGGRNGPGARFHVDHCHNSNKVRGLLCSRCNTAIGLLQDDPELAESAATYLRR